MAGLSLTEHLPGGNVILHDISQPDRHNSSIRIYLPHHTDLVVDFLHITLVYANRVSPDASPSQSQALQAFPQIPLDEQHMLVDIDDFIASPMIPGVRDCCIWDRFGDRHVPELEAQVIGTGTRNDSQKPDLAFFEWFVDCSHCRISVCS